MMQINKKLFSLFLCAVWLFLLTACAPERTEPSGADADIDIVSEYRFGDGGVPLPEGAQRVTEGGSDGAARYRIDDKAALDAYAADAEQQGCIVEELPYFTLIFRDGAYLFFYKHSAEAGDGEPSADLTVYCGSAAPDGGLSPEQAREIIDPDSPLIPIDVSPEGLYENTGGQLFLLPIYSGDYRAALYGMDDFDDTDTPENKMYYERYYYVSGDDAVPLDMPALAFADLDGDGIRETVRLGYGPTSGISSYTITVFRGGEQLAQRIAAPQDQAANLSFAAVDGALRLTAGSRTYAITLSGSTVTLTDENGNPFENLFGESD